MIGDFLDNCHILLTCNMYMCICMLMRKTFTVFVNECRTVKIKLHGTY